MTLVELLAVIAIICVLMALLLPAVQNAREMGRATQCRSNLKQVAIALLGFESAYRCFPPGGVTGAPPTKSATNSNPFPGLKTVGVTGFKLASADQYSPYKLPAAGLSSYATGGLNVGWPVFLLAYVEQSTLADQFDKDVPWFDDPNLAVSRQSAPPCFLCPSAAVENRVVKQLNLTAPAGEAATYFFGALGGSAGLGRGMDYAAVTGKNTVSLWSDEQDSLSNALVSRVPAGSGIPPYSSPAEYPMPGWTAYPGNVPGRAKVAMPINSARSAAKVRDGLSATIFVAEVAGRPWICGSGRACIPVSNKPAGGSSVSGPSYDCAWTGVSATVWLKGSTFDGMTLPGPCTMNCTNEENVYSFHRGGAGFVFGDGSVRFLSEMVPWSVLAPLMTIDGGESVSTDSF